MGATWKLSDAKARFSELVRKAQTEGVQRVALRGRDAVAVISVDELDRLLNAQQAPPLLDFLESLGLHELDLERPPDRDRTAEL